MTHIVQMNTIITVGMFAMPSYGIDGKGILNNQLRSVISFVKILFATHKLLAPE